MGHARRPASTRHLASTRHAAYDAWHGPKFATEPDDEVALFGGPLVLKLALRQGTSMVPRLFSRSIFARLHESDDALIRAMSWIRGQGPVPADKIAIRFVRIPKELALQWLQSLDSLPLTVRMNSERADATDIRTLWHELDYVYSTFELTWQVTPPKTELDLAWERLWHAIGEQLQQSSPVELIDESFPSVEFAAHNYDFEQVPLDPVF
jgi:hypothetical protein